MGRFMFQADNGDIGSVKFEGGDGNKDILIPKEGGTLATETFVTNSAEIITAGTGLEKSGTTLSIKDDYLTPIITTGTATFSATTNNINLTGIGIGVEIGDVIQISGADDAKNNSEFTVEVITDNDNIIVNQAHANKGTTKNVAYKSGDTGVTVKLLAKHYNAPLGLGQAWVDMTASRLKGTTYPNNTGRAIQLSIPGYFSSGDYQFYINDVQVEAITSGTSYWTFKIANIIASGDNYRLTGTGIYNHYWLELR